MRLWVTGLLIVTALGLGGRLALISQQSRQSLGVSDPGPQHRSQSLVTLVYNEQGSLHYRLAAAAAQHDPRGKVSHFEHPTLQLFDEHSQISWAVGADQARLLQQRQLYLSGNIEITSLLADPVLQKMVTEQLQIDLVDQTIQSDQRVMLYGRQFTSQGNGLQGNLKQRVFTLLNSVKTLYDSQPPA